MVFGRDADLRLVASFLDAPGPGSLVIEGPAGVGKSTVWEMGIAGAGAGRRTLVTRARHTEADWSYGGLNDLFGSSLDEVATELPARQTEVLRIALLQAPATGEALNAREVAVAVLSLLRLLASDGPLVLAIDDVQWLDQATFDVLAFAVWRLAEQDVLILATDRVEDAPKARSSIGFSGGRNERLRLNPLDEAAIGLLARARLGFTLSRSRIRSLAALSGGNPFFAVELLRSYANDPDSLDAGRVPPDLAVLVRGRLDDLPADTNAALPLVAAPARPTLPVLAELVDLKTLDPAFASRVLRLDRDEVRFAHPLIAAAALESLAPGERIELHARLADVAPTREERARHLALATLTPSSDVASALEEAATDAAARGAPTASAELLEHALRLTPGDDHPGLAARGAGLVSSYRAAGDLELAAVRGRELAERLPCGPLRATVLAAVADTEALPLWEAVETAQAALDEAGSDTTVRARALLVLANAHINANDFRAALTCSQEALAFAEGTADHRLRVHAMALTGELEIQALDAEGWRRLRAAMELEGHDRIPDTYVSPAGRLGACAVWADEVDSARPLLEGQHTLSCELGDEYSRAGFCHLLVELECRAGRIEHARRYARESLFYAEQSGHDRSIAAAHSSVALVEALAGDADAALHHGGRAVAITTQIGDVLYWIRARGALGHFELSRGNHRDALAHLDGLQARLDEIGILEPGCIPIHVDAIEAEILAGDPAQAEASIDAWEALGQRLGRRSILATAFRARGMLAGRRGEHEQAVAALECARELDAGSPLPMQRARTLLALGGAYRRTKQRRRAREALGEAARVFLAAPATLWAAQARAELGRVSGRSSSDRGELTSTEERVAQLVAEGRTNREVAAALYITVGTVETNLTRIYRKLGVRSRTELARAYTSRGADE